MGLATQMIAWDDGVLRACSPSAASTSCASTTATSAARRTSPAPPPTLKQMLRARPAGRAYTLSDMADDAVGLLDQLGVDAAHVVGASMGGMIAQTIAIEHPDRVLLARLDHVQHGQPLARPAGALRSSRSSCAARRATARATSSTS